LKKVSGVEEKEWRESGDKSENQDRYGTGKSNENKE
jgi:hypothetical protein